MPDTIVPVSGHIATTNMHIGAQLPTCEWARKVADGQGKILANYSQMIFTHGDNFEHSYPGGNYWSELANHKCMLPHLATHFAVSFAAAVKSGAFNPLTAGNDWEAAAALLYNATGETFWVGTADFTMDTSDRFAGTRVRFMIDALAEGVLTSGHMDEVWRIEIYLKAPYTPGYTVKMHTWAHAFYGAYLPLK